MAAGKNKVERWFRVWFDDSGGTPRDLSGDLVPGSASGLGGATYEQIEMTGVSEAHKNYLAGFWSHEFGGSFYMNDTATTGAHTVLKGMVGSVGTLTLQFGAGAAPTTGDPEWEGEYLLAEMPYSLSGGKPVAVCRLVPSGSTPPAWGTVA